VALKDIQRELYKQLKYQPTPLQKYIIEDDSRITLIAGGERAGKSLVTAKKALPLLMIANLYWLVGQEYSACRAEWTYLIDDLTRLGILNSATKNLDPGVINYLDNKRIITLPTAQPTKIATEAPDGIIISEAAQIDYEAYLRLRGRIAEKRGWMIMSGTFENCLTADTLVPTKRGILPICQVDVGDIINGITGNAEVSDTWVIGKKPIVKLTLDKNFHISGTLDHKVVTRKPDGSVVWEELDKIQPKDLVAIRVGTNLWGNYHLEPDDAYFLGLYTAEGCMDNPRTGYRTTITNGDDEIRDFLLSWDFKPAQKYHYRRNDKAFYQWLESIGANPELKAKTKVVPDNIFMSDKETVCNFLSGLFDGDGSVTNRILYYTSSANLAYQVQALLLNLGIVSSVMMRNCWLGKKCFPSYTIAISDSTIFLENIRFRLTRKNNKAKTLNKPGFLRNQANAGQYFMEYPVCWCHVKNKTYGEEEVYDITIPNGHAFCANGLIVHNSLGWYPEAFTRWQAYNDEEAKSFSLPTWSNIFIYPGGRNDPEILSLEKVTPADKFKERYGGVPCPPSNKAVPEFSNQIHVGNYLYDSNLPVYISVDPGYAGAHAVEAIQLWDDKVVLIDEIYLQNVTTKEMIIVAKQKPWWGNVDGGTIDIAGKQHQAMEAPVEVWLNEAHIHLKSQKVSEEAGLDVLRSFMKVNPVDGQPRILVNPRCKGFISECGGCQNPVGGGMWMRNKNTGKLIDQDNHAAKAVIYYLVNTFGYVERTGRLPIIKINATRPQETYVRT